MKKMKKLWLILLSCMLIVASGLVLTACDKTPSDTDTSSGDNTGDKKTYTVSLKTAAGMNLEGIDVCIYADNTLKDMKQIAKTDANGIVTFSMPASDSYAIQLTGVPAGYRVADSYSFSGDTSIISLSSELRTDASITEYSSAKPLKAGDIMCDFTYTNTEGKQVKLSDVLKEKKLVVLNFWYTGCTWCREEFPVMSSVYEDYKEDVEIIALNYTDESMAAIQGFQQEFALPFQVGECPYTWFDAFGFTGAPSSVFIDQYGVISLVEVGAVTSKRPWVCAFEHFTAEDYEQKICASIGDLVTLVKPNVSMDTSDNVAAAIGNADGKVTFRPESGDDAETTWPFIIGDKNGTTSLYASNKGIDSSYAILYMDVELKKGQALAFDYLASTEANSDFLYVIVDEERIFSISGVNEVEKWEKCYPCVATEDGTYEVALCYLKDDSDEAGDDTVYIKNVRIVDADNIDTETYIPREAATSTDGFKYNYVDIVYSETDGYYHVGSKKGPLLLANLMGVTQFNEENAVYLMFKEGDKLMVNGVDCFEKFEDYCSYANNGTLTGYSPITKELMSYLQAIDKLFGFDDADDMEWMKLCRYYEAYGSNGKQLEDPIKGLATFSAFKATLGKNISTNFFYYDGRAIMPRGMFAEFIPTKSGAYRITSRSGNTAPGPDGWIFDKDRNILLTYEPCERTDTDNEVSMVFYMEAGTPYYINIAHWDVYGLGTIYYDIEYLEPTIDLFRLASPAFFTYDTNATGTDMYHVIAGGIDVVLKDGIYYEDLGKDKNGKQLYGSKLYCDFSGLTGVMSHPIYAKDAVDMIELGGFDFSKSENDLYIIALMNKYETEAKVKEFLKSEWGADYDANYEEYKVEDVFAGRYHGTGKDMSDVVKKYISKMEKNGIAQGCVVVTEELAEALQLLMDKYTFKDVDHSWTKLCYYYDYIGPDKNR